MGFDLHKYEDGSGMILGGYHIDCDYKIIAHSDGDVLLHSIADSILGAAGLDDIGKYFSDQDDKNENEEIVDVKGTEHLFFFEGELASQCIAKEKTEPPHPAMTWEDTLGNLKALDTWREKVNYKLPQDEI